MNKVKHLFNHAFLVTAIVCSLALVGLTEQEAPAQKELVKEEMQSKSTTQIIQVRKCS